MSDFYRGIFLLLIIFTALTSAHERIALVIGANRGLVSERQLRFAVPDARRIRDVLVELGRFSEDRTYLLINPSIRDIEKNIDELRGRIKEIRGNGKKVEFFFYYSGHGSADALHIGNATFTHDSLLSVIETSGADLTLALVDACYSGALVAEKGISIAPPLSIKMVDTLSARGTIMLTSSSSDQVSHEAPELGGSVFTHHMISALRGAADYDESRTVSLSEAYSYARMKTSSITGNLTGTMQQPSYSWNVKGKEEICLSWLTQGKGKIVILPGGQCPCYIINEPSQTVMAEIIPRSKPVPIALPAGRYRVQQVCEKSISCADVDLSWKNACTLSLGSLREFPRNSFTGKGPMDRPSAIHSVKAGVLLSAGYPDAATVQVLTSGTCGWYNGFYCGELTFAYGRCRYKGSALSVDRSTIHLSALLTKIVYSPRNLSVDIGIQAGTHFNSQQIIRPEEMRLRAVGYPSIEPQKTIVPFGGVSLRITPVITGRIPLYMTVGVNDYFARMSDGYHQFVRPYCAVKAGMLFHGIREGR